MKNVLLLSTIVLLSSCASIKNYISKRSTKSEKNPRTIEEIISGTDDKYASKKKILPEIFENKEITSLEKEEIDSVRSVEQNVAVQNSSSAKKTAKTTFNLDYKKKHYDFWIKYFTKKEKERFNRHMKNGDQYVKLVKSILREHNLPEDLYYVGLIESGYNTYIRSHASAVGPWQFIRGTATRYGMRVDRYLDERTNVIKSTHAAAKYFKDLYNIFGSWELALCAYNAGEYRIINAIRKGNTRDYKQLVKKRLIPKETIYYIPKIAAAKYLDVHRRKYGFERGSERRDISYAKEVKISKTFSLKKISKSTGISLKKLKTLNPDIKDNWVRVGRKDFSLYVPSRNFEKVASLKINHKRPKRLISSDSTHKVRRGEYLGKIARQYGVRVRDIMRVNNLRSKKILVGQRLKIPGTYSYDKATRKYSAVSHKYKVRKGDYLLKIAKKFKTSISKIKKLNKLRSNKLYVGQRLIVPGYNKRVSYTVRKGDNLYKIARRFNSTINKIVAFNGLKSRKIYPKQKIYIP